MEYNKFLAGAARSNTTPPMGAIPCVGYETWRARSSFMEPDAEKLLR